MSTTNKANAENTTHNAGMAWQNGIAESMRDLVGLQIRTAQFVLDKSMTIGQAVSDFCQNQINESMKLSQECAKASWGLGETIKKGAYEFTDRAVRNINAGN